MYEYNAGFTDLPWLLNLEQFDLPSGIFSLENVASYDKVWGNKYNIIDYTPKMQNRQ